MATADGAVAEDESVDEPEPLASMRGVDDSIDAESFARAMLGITGATGTRAGAGAGGGGEMARACGCGAGAIGAIGALTGAVATGALGVAGAAACVGAGAVRVAGGKPGTIVNG
jgi:hypothetical protein